MPQLIHPLHHHHSEARSTMHEVQRIERIALVGRAAILNEAMQLFEISEVTPELLAQVIEHMRAVNEERAQKRGT